MSEWTPYQTNHLFLLVGRNPLPNYVAARLLLQPAGTLHLLHSAGPLGTGQVAQNLMAHFPENNPQLIPVDSRDIADIRRQAERYLECLSPGSVGLNYTGGTKIMAVQTYRLIEEFCRRRGREAVFSYLDADTLEMSVDPQPGHRAFRHKVALEVTLSIEDLYNLHGIRLVGQPQIDPRLPDLARALAQMHGTSAGIQAWRKSRQVLKSCDGRLWREVKAELIQIGTTSEVITLLEKALALEDSKPVSLRTAAREAGFKSSRALLLWLIGFWLEHWALACIRDLGYKHRAQGLTGMTSRRFEIDVAVMRGYQLFALSCGVTDDHRRAKLKLLEIYTRAMQIGGDEARVGLVCAVDDPHGLEQEIASDWGSANRVCVFGHKHWPELQVHFKRWFETV